MEEVEARITAAGRLLAGLHGQAASEASASQATAIEEQLQSVSVPIVKLVALTDLVSGVKWANQDDKQRVLSALTQRSQAPGRAARVKQQNFEALGYYFVAREWRSLMDTQLDFMTKAKLVLDRAISLGLRNPTENTMAFTTAILLVCTEGVEKAKTLSPGYARDCYVHLKAMLKQRSKGAAMEVVMELPSSIAEFEGKFPRTYAAVFSEAPPIDCQVPYSDINAVKQSIVMRDRERLSGSTTLQSSNIRAGHGDPGNVVQMLASLIAAQTNMEGNRMRLNNGANLQLLGGRAPAHLRNALAAADGFAHSSSHPLDANATLQMLPAPAPPNLGESSLPPAPAPPQLGESSLPTAGQAEPTMQLALDDISHNPAKPDPVKRQSVENATKAILEAMEKKSDEKKTEKKVMKRPASASVDVETPAPKSSKGSASPVKAPTFSNERSRSQIMFRTGLPGPGQNTAIYYDSPASEKVAIAKAKKLVLAEKLKRGLV